MARPFTSKEIYRLISDHQDLLDRLQEGRSVSESYRDQVREAADELVANEIITSLKGIPVEAINRDKRGFRVKALREQGFTTIADLSAASVYNIASVQGVSENSAYAIKRIVNELIAQARKDVKIRLSVDDKTKMATQLISAVSKYRQSLPYAASCRQLLSSDEKRITYAIEDLVPARSGLRWLFTTKKNKQMAQDAFRLLSELLTGDYGTQAQHALSALDSISLSSSSAAWDDFQNNPIQFFNILEDICPGLLASEDESYGLPEDLAREIQEECIFPDGLLCELRRYQEWGVKYALHQERVLLGDEMGLGKTVQAIAVMVSLKNTGATHFMVVCPASVIENWCREIRKHSKLSVIKIYGQDRMAAFRSWIFSGGVAVTNFETTGYLKLKDNYQFTLLTVDEAHYIKNPKARRTVNVKHLADHSERLLFMTGTALENKVEEMISLISILQPSVALQVRNMVSLASAPRFRKRIAPVYFRRKREDVLKELPSLIENREWCTLFPEEKTRYESAILEKHYTDARRVSWNVDDLGCSSKAIRMMEIIEEAEEEGRKIIVFSFFLDTIRKISLQLGSRCTEPISGSVPIKRRQEIIDQFDQAPAGTVLVAQIQSGGTGLNIQSASVVILCEPQLKPSIENQAISRAYRMGQTRSVLVYRLLCQNTIDERITDLLEQKQARFDAFADKSEAAKESLELDDKTLGNIIQDEIDRINSEARHQTN